MLKSNLTQSCTNLFRRSERTKLSNKCRCNLCNNLVTALDCLNQLKNLGFIRNRAEWAADKALTTGNAFIVVDLCSAILIAFNCVDTTSCCARTFTLYDCGIWASLSTSSAFDTF